VNGKNGNSSKRRIVLTGGPGGGKTTAADLFRREMGDHIIIVPEAATLLFSGGFPRSNEPHAKRAAQRAMFHVQRNLEDVQSARFPERILLCDRGTVDGAAYWPDDGEDFFSALGTTREAEYTRYDAVLFFESAAVGGLEVVEGGNPVRTESIDSAAAIDARLRECWADHPNFVLIPHETSFFHKMARALQALQDILVRLERRNGNGGHHDDRNGGGHEGGQTAV
jgi:predicted ATPase